jgi:hypothetical protein
MAKARRHARIKVSEIRSLALLQCSDGEAAAHFGVTLKTWKELLRIDTKAREAWEHGRQVGRTSLRRKQFNLASTNASMAIFLGKQYLGQNDVQVLEHSGRDGAPIQTQAINFKDLTKEERAALRSIATRARGK